MRTERRREREREREFAECVDSPPRRLSPIGLAFVRLVRTLEREKEAANFDGHKQRLESPDKVEKSLADW